MTRPRPQAAALVARLVALGAEVIEAPAIAIRPPDDPGPLQDALGRLAEFDWVVFTSANGVEAVAGRLESSGAGLEALSGCRIGAVGPGTRDALEERGVPVELMPDSYRVDALAEKIIEEWNVTGARFLLPRADRANPVLTEVLLRAGAKVTAVVAYRTVTEEKGADGARAALEGRCADYLTFTSASTVRGFAEQVGADAIRRATPPLSVVSIGPETSRAAREAGIDVHLEADPHTIEGLLTIMGRSETGGDVR